MEASSFFVSILNMAKGISSWVWKKSGYKIVKRDDYVEVPEEIDRNKIDEYSWYPQYRQEKDNGSKFYLSKKRHPGYVKFYVTEDNKKTYFTDSGYILWIKRPNKVTDLD